MASREKVRGSAIILGFRPDDPSTPHILLCQRSPNGIDDDGEPKKNAFPWTWETPGGGALPEDGTILETMVRETAEETELVLWAASSRVYRREMKSQRLWSDGHDGPHGSDQKPIRLRDDEHLDYVWATEEQVQTCMIYDPSDTNKAGIVMIQSNKDVLLDFYSWLKDDGACMEYPLPELPLQSDQR
ncbi:hypothetical protein N7481_008467 [Penicillium waksmanii]|uniref:uncharacterized protein n=1 Tax=Penicillium waksmanii TaxID=69791 RepID=UPI00254744A8|nr:uncharacterized protein N7481_008467 [Penicillium waksmanii]KAJ5974760.1 hypothetical protein N7481_008467 [Penicillium waksmanii]